MYKLSQYIISQDFHDSKDRIEKTVLLNTKNSVVKILDSNTFSMLSSNLFSLIDNDLLNNLKEDGILVDDNENELQSIVKDNNDFILNSRELYLVVQPTAFCPFGCHYCGQSHSPKPMLSDIQDQIVERTKNKIVTNSYEKLRICWFGSEPLAGIASLRKLSYKLQSLAEQTNIDYTAKIVTNGWQLTPFIAKDLIHNHKVNHIEITLDGINEFHDARRHTKNGDSTFEQIYENLLSLCYSEDMNNVILSIRCNVDERNKEGISPLIKKLAQDNLQDKIYLYFAQIHSWGNDAHKLAADKQNFSDWEIEWFLEMESLGFNVNYLPSRKKQVCMTMNPNSELIDPSGGIFRCTEVSLVPSYENETKLNRHQLGHVNNSTEALKENEFADFYEETELKKFFCHKCEIFPICGGSCPKEWKEGRIPCPSVKFNIKKRLMLFYLKNLHKQEYNQFLNTMNPL